MSQPNRALRSYVLLPAFFATACAAIAPQRVYVMPFFERYMYEGEEAHLVSQANAEGSVVVTLTIRNLRTGKARELAFDMPPSATHSIKLASEGLPDLDSAPTGVEPYAFDFRTSTPGADGGPDPLSVLFSAFANPGNGSGSTYQLSVVKDPAARLPAFISNPSVEGPCCNADWQQVADETPMADAALAEAYRWGGRQLEVSASLATEADFASTRRPGFRQAVARIHRFEVRGQFPRQVVVKDLTGGPQDTLTTPKGLVMLLPQIRHPLVLEIDPLLE